MLGLDSSMPPAGQLARSGGCVLIRPALTLAVMDDHSNAHYQIHIRGLLSDRLLSAFPELRARARNHETVLDGSLPDQSALHGVLGRIESLGLELLEVRRMRTRAQKPSDADEPAEAEEPGVVASDRASDNLHSSHSAGPYDRTAT